MKFLMLLLIRFYQKCLSPFLPHVCRYKPSCSEYFAQALITHGVFRGSYLGIRRILRCHPWGGQGHDPVPQPKVSKKNKSLASRAKI